MLKLKLLGVVLLVLVVERASAGCPSGGRNAAAAAASIYVNTVNDDDARGGGVSKMWGGEGAPRGRGRRHGSSGGTVGRKLRQTIIGTTVDDVSPPMVEDGGSMDVGISPGGSPGDGVQDGGPLQTEEVDQFTVKCALSFNTYLFPFSNGNRQLTDPKTNLKGKAQDCCASCYNMKGCNAWQWCPVEVGCSFANTTGKVLSNTTFPYLGCQLMNLEGFSPYAYNLTDVKSRGDEIPFIAGTSANIEYAQVGGFDAFPGQEIPPRFDFDCDLEGSQLVWSSSAERGCVINGTVEAVGKSCSSIEKCVGFSFYPNGYSGVGSSFGVLKSGDIDDGALELNPSSVTYIITGLIPTAGLPGDEDSASSSEGSSTTSVVVIAVVSTVVGLALVAGFVLVVYYVHRYKKMTRSFPSEKEVPKNPESDKYESDDGPNRLNGVHSIALNTSGDSESDMTYSDIAGNSTQNGFAYNDNNSRQLHVSPGRMSQVVVSEIPVGQAGPTPPSSGGIQEPTAPPYSNGPGASARDLMDAFSQMYKQRPVVDYQQLGSMLEDDEARAAAELEAAVDESRKSNTSSVLASQSSDVDRSAKIPSAIAKESTGLVEAGLTDDWSILPEEVEVCRRPDGTWWQLGTGGFGTVYKGLYHGIHPVAIKILHHVEEQRHTDAFVREATLLKALRHRNVVQFLGASLDGPQGTALLVTELMELGDLWRALSAKDANGDRIFSWHSRGKQCMIDVAKGLHYLHMKRVVHFDLKSANILLSRAGTAKLADIGMARVLNKSYLSVISGLGTFAWSAPEVLSGKRCTEKADIYSFGVVLWEVCTGEAPTRGDMRPLQSPSDCPQDIVDLYLLCVSENPEDRPSAREVLEVLDAIPEAP